MIRTQISLDEQEYELARREAQAQGVSLAELVRQAIRRVLPAPGTAEAPWMRYAGFIESGDPASSQRIDEVIYGSKE